MPPPIANQVCKECGAPAVEGWVELDGRVTYFCERHAGTSAPAQSDEPDDPKDEPKS
jgi:hypothetical protein